MWTCGAAILGYFALQDEQELKILIGLGWFSILGGNK